MRIGIAFILFLFTITSCEKDTKNIDQFFTKNILPNEFASNLKTIYSDSARMYFIMEAKEMLHIKNTQTDEIQYNKGLKMSFLNKNGSADSWLVGDKAVEDRIAHKFHIIGNVRLFNTKNDKMQTSELIWDSNREIIYSDKFVKITQPSQGDTLYGYGFKSNKQFTQFEIVRRMSGIVIEGMVNELYR